MLFVEDTKKTKFEMRPHSLINNLNRTWSSTKIERPRDILVVTAYINIIEFNRYKTEERTKIE